MKRKLTSLLFILLLFCLTGCRLAQMPSEQQLQNSELAEARFMGLYVVREERFTQPDRTHWTEYGSYTVDTEHGKLTTGQEILIGLYDDTTHDVTFPGLEGHALFAMNVTSANSGSYSTVISDMVGGSFHVTGTDAGTNYELSGTLYFSPPDNPGYDQWNEDYIWHHYHVYQMEDGTVFLNGYGDSHNGPMGSTVTVSTTSTINGAEQDEVYTQVEVQVEYISRLAALTVLQYDGQGNLLERLELPTEGDLPSVTWLPTAEWAVVEEMRGEEVTRTAYERPSEQNTPVSHTVILPGINGICRGGSLRFQ